MKKIALVEQEFTRQLELILLKNSDLFLVPIWNRIYDLPLTDLLL